MNDACLDAHELRSPLTALEKVQTEVAQLSDDPQARKKALLQLHYGIDQASRLVDRLYRGWTHWITFRHADPA